MSVSAHTLSLKTALPQAKNVFHLLCESIDQPEDKPFEVPVFSPIHQNNPDTIPTMFSKHVCELPVKVYRPMDPMRHDAHYVMTDKEVRVVYSSHHNLCWARFFVVKELCHTLFFHNENESGIRYETNNPQDVVKLINKLLVDGSIKENDISPQFSADVIAYQLATEILIPEKWVDQLNGARIKLQSDKGIEDGKEIFELAKFLLVPEQILEYRLGFAM